MKIFRQFIIRQSTQNNDHNILNPVSQQRKRHAFTSQSKFRCIDKKPIKNKPKEIINKKHCSNKQNNIQSPLRSSIRKSGLNIEDCYNCYSYYQKLEKNEKNKQKPLFSLTQSKSYNKIKGTSMKLKNKMVSISNQFQNNNSYSNIFKNKLLKTESQQNAVSQNPCFIKQKDSYFWFEDRLKKSPVKQILKFNDRQRKVFLNQLLNNRISCAQISQSQQSDQQRIPINIKQSKAIKIKLNTQPCENIDKNSAFLKAFTNHLQNSQKKENQKKSQDKKNNLRCSINTNRNSNIYSSLLKRNSKFSSYQQNSQTNFKKYSIMNISARSSMIKNPKYRISREQKENIDKIIRNSMISLEVPQQSMRSLKAQRRQTQFLKKVFDKKIRQMSKLKKKGSFQDQGNQQQTLKLAQAYAGTLIGDKHLQNQDAIQFSDNIYIVCDGHGTNGRKISKFVSQQLHKYAKQKLVFGDNQINQKTIKEVFKLTEKQLDQSGLDITFSGCTALFVVKDGQNLFCAGVGDSKAIVVSNQRINQISVMHKPNVQKQKQRIQAAGGVIRQTQISHNKFSGPMRIWAPGRISWGPGLALSRAFGDKAAKKYGVIAEPQITNIKLTFDEDFIILGSDGLFDVMTDQQISATLKRLLKDQDKSKQNVCQQIIQIARQKWKDDSDDISCILVIL